jgi:hypothetical protein
MTAAWQFLAYDTLRNNGEQIALPSGWRVSENEI